MNESFDGINAPQYYDFNQEMPPDEEDGFFDNYHQEKTMVLETSKHDNCEVADPLAIDKNFGGFSYSDIDNEGTPTPERLSYEHSEKETHSVRRSLSMSDLFHVKESLKNAHLSNGNKHDLATSNQSTEKLTNGCTKTTDKQRRSVRSLSKESINRLAQPKKYGSHQNLNRPYVALAEAVNKFQNNTPERFKIKPKLGVNHHHKLESTIPQSPHLLCTKRARPVLVLSRVDQEQKEYEEAQRYKIKAQPVNEKMLRGPIKPSIAIVKKPSTIPKPFKLTEIHHTSKQPEPEQFTFHAQSVPNFNKSSTSKPIAHKPLTKPQTPTVLLRKSRKDEIIEKYLEEERKAREFHARPVPKTIHQSTKHNSSEEKKEVNNSHKSQENISIEFKARPPTVLYKKPFEPVKKERPLVKMSEFKLSTDQRAQERQAFEQFLKEKEEAANFARQQAEQRRILEEQEEINKLRKMAEVKAQPIRKYSELIIQPSGKVTEPVSPKFHKRNSSKTNSSHDGNKENMRNSYNS